MTIEAIAFAGSKLDRADHVRTNPDALNALMDWRARVLELDGLEPVVTPEGTLSWRTLAAAPEGSEFVFLGLDGDRGCFAAVPAENPGGAMVPTPRIRGLMELLNADELATWGLARAMVGWHARHRFCARCGHPTALAKGGWQRNCTYQPCAGEHFPRVDPVAIMLVEHNGMMLLGRQPRFPAGRYSTLAGFVEPGETIEESVAREVFEEAGLRVRDVEYIMSQPWPFPSSLMIGCHAHADDPKIVVDRTELDDARWFTRAEVAEAMEATARDESGAAFHAPPPTAVAHHLLKWWLARG